LAALQESQGENKINVSVKRVSVQASSGKTQEAVQVHVQSCSAHHCVTAWHCTSEVLVAAATWKVPLPHAVTNAHSRSLVGVGGWT